MIGTGVFVGRPTLRASMAQGLFLGGTGRRAVAHTRPEFPKMPTAPSAFPLLGAPQAPGDKPKPEPRPDNSAGQSATQHLERSSPKSICHQNDRDRNLLVLELLPYMVNGLAHYAEKVGDTQQKVTCESSVVYFWVVKRISFPFSIFEETCFIAVFDRPPGD